MSGGFHVRHTFLYSHCPVPWQSNQVTGIHGHVRKQFITFYVNLYVSHTGSAWLTSKLSSSDKINDGLPDKINNGSDRFNMYAV